MPLPLEKISSTQGASAEGSRMRCNLSFTAQFSTVQASSTPDHTGLRFNEHIRAGGESPVINLKTGWRGPIHPRRRVAFSFTAGFPRGSRG